VADSLARPIRIAAALILTVSLSLGCGGSDEAAPADLEIVFGEGGGITGRWRGHAIDARGALEEWTGTSITSRTETATTRMLDRSEMAELWATIVELDVLAHADAEYGAMTRAIHLTADDSTYVFAWPTPVESDTLSRAQKLYAHCHALVRPDAR
jgi:hypothetical protein